MATTRAILFDFWQTLFSDAKERDTMSARKQLLRDYLARCGCDGAANLDAAFEASRPWFMDIYLREQRTPLVDERLRWVLSYLKIDLESRQLAEISEQFGSMGLMLDPQLTPHAREVLCELAQKYRLGIVSDTGYTPGRILRRQMEKHGILQQFSAFAFSDETGHAKPHRMQFLSALAELGTRPQDAIHCGDLPTHDIRGARELGITAIQYTGCHAEPAGDLRPDFIIADWRELPPIVDQVFG